MKQEMMADVMDDIFEEEGEEEATEEIINQVLDDIGITLSTELADPPTSESLGAQGQKTPATALTDGGGGPSKGGKGPKPAKAKVPVKKDLSKKDYEFLEKQTGLNKQEIQKIYVQFIENNPDGQLDRQEFVRLYDKLRSEPPQLLDEISVQIFNCFDKDRNGKISFDEFMVAYALTSRGDVAQKLDYAFHLYDTDGNGYLDSQEVKEVLVSMLDLLGAEKKSYNLTTLTQECMKDLDKSHDGKITKDEFIGGLLKNYSLRELMSPFN